MMGTREETLLHARYKGYCTVCHHTIWRGEQIKYNGKTSKHVDCLVALRDGTPRVMDKKYEAILGRVNKKKLRTLASQRTGQAKPAKKS